MTRSQKGQLVKGMVNGALEGKDITAEPVAINISDGEEHVGTLMRSMQDSKTMEAVTALQQDGIRTTIAGSSSSWAAASSSTRATGGTRCALPVRPLAGG